MSVPCTYYTQTAASGNDRAIVCPYINSANNGVRIMNYRYYEVYFTKLMIIYDI